MRKENVLSYALEKKEEIIIKKRKVIQRLHCLDSAQNRKSDETSLFVQLMWINHITITNAWPLELFLKSRDEKDFVKIFLRKMYFTVIRCEKKKVNIFFKRYYCAKYSDLRCVSCFKMIHSSRFLHKKYKNVMSKG